VAEVEGHHPQIVTEWGSVLVSWWSHKINNIHLNDLILAARCDQRFRKFQV
jgi:4a-hydroxytetrahydrobiopterin dehydratase